MTLKLYIQPKTIIFAGRINEPSAVEYPRDLFQYDGVTTGTFSVVTLNQTVLLGSTAGGWDLGITRTRLHPTSGTMYIGRSSKGVRIGETTLTDNAFFSVVSGTRVWSKVPYIDDDGETFFDSSLDYPTFGANSPPVANAGAAVIGTINPSTSLLTVNFSAAASFVTMPGAAISSYAWNVGSGTITVGTVASQDITATFAAGFYVVTLLVADDNAKSHMAYVPVLAINPATDPCLYNFEIVSHRIGVQGQELQVRIRQAIDEATYLDGTWVALADGDPADADDRSNVVFQGWIESSDEEIRATPTGLLREVTLTLVDVAGRLKTLPGYSTVIEHAASPTKWQEMTTPDMRRLIHYLLQWQSNALDVADFTFYGDEDDYTFSVLSSDGASLFEQVNRRAEALIPDHLLTCNRLGQLAIGIDPLLQDSADRTSAIQATLTPAFYSDIRYRQQRGPRVHWLRSNTLLIGTGLPIGTAFCIAPGNAPGQGLGATDDGEHLSLTADDLNATTGHRYARLNAPQGIFTITLAEGNDYTLDPSALTWLQVTIDAATAAQRGLTFSEARFLMRQLDIRYNHGATGLTKTVTIQAERETVGIPAVTVEVPPAAPVDDGGWVPAPVIPDPAFDNGLTVGQNVVGFITRQGYIYKCPDFTDPGEPTWSRNTTAATAASIGTNDLYTFVVDPFSPGYRGTPGGTINGWAAGETAVYRVADLFGTPSYTAVYTYGTNAPNLTHEWAQVAASFGRYEAVEADNPWVMVAYSAGPSSSPIRTYIAYSRDGGDTWSSEIDVSAQTRTAVQQERSWPALWLSPRTPGLAYAGAWEATGTQPDGGLFVSTNWGATWASASTIAPDTGQSIGFSLHVPWQSNDSQDVAYYCHFNRDSSIYKYRLHRSVGGVATEISPVDTGKKYGPARGLFSIQSLDTNRQELIMAGVYDDTGNQEVLGSGSVAVSSIWRSSNAGTTWTRITSDLSTTPNDDCVMQVAFAAGDASIFFGWGGGGYLLYTEDGGSTMVNKSPTVSLATNSEIMGIFGGGA